MWPWWAGSLSEKKYTGSSSFPPCWATENFLQRRDLTLYLKCCKSLNSKISLLSTFWKYIWNYWRFLEHGVYIRLETTKAFTQHNFIHPLYSSFSFPSYFSLVVKVRMYFLFLINILKLLPRIVLIVKKYDSILTYLWRQWQMLGMFKWKVSFSQVNILNTDISNFSQIFHQKTNVKIEIVRFV